MNDKATNSTDSDTRCTASPCYIVAIGASAGGLESLEQLFRNMPTQTSMAFVVIQHLSPDFKSMMGELLARDTSIRIVTVEEGCPILPNTIYLMPPKKQMQIANGTLHLSDKVSDRHHSLPIDHFLESLASECGSMGVAVILSGSGTDGTHGLIHVSKAGGLVISESLDTAKFDGMPSSAQATGHVDLVLQPSDMGRALADYTTDPAAFRKTIVQHSDEPNLGHGIDAIIQLFRSHYNIDFASYRESTVMRRIMRRVEMHHSGSLEHYALLLQKDPAELQSLYRDLLIGVTQFFRDPEAFEYLMREIIPDVLAAAEKRGAVRVWVAGCATGEEAYSIAIAFSQIMQERGVRLPIKIFATDVHKRSIEHASRGIFSVEVLRGVPDELIDKYFTVRTDGYQILPDIRQSVVFAQHNVLRDAPFTDLDLITCRNMLIYLKISAQRRAISLFHYGLRVGGILLLGSSESTGELSREFDVLNSGHRIYRKRRDVRLTHNLRSPLTSSDAVPLKPEPSPFAGRSRPIATRTLQIQEALIERFVPAGIVIDASRAVIDTFGGAEKLLRFPMRQPSLDILDLVDREIRTTLAGAIGRSIKNHTLVKFGKLSFPSDSGARAFNLTVEPLCHKEEEAFYLITFHPIVSKTSIEDERLQESGNSNVAVLSEEAETVLELSQEQVHRLEDDLRYSRENLQATIEELETSNEELQATNEELIASNEELQSTNEELHSLNEELYTVNAEHQRKIEQLAELNRDMSLLLENTEVAMIFLDSELRIRRFTSRVRQVFDLIDEDVGRSINAFGTRQRIEDLNERLQNVLMTGNSFEREVQSADGVTYLMRLLPYRRDKRVDGVLLLWIDVSSLELLKERMRWFTAIVESTSDAIIGLDLSGTISSWNRGAEALYGYSADEAIGNSINMLVPEDRQQSDLLYRERILKGETLLNLETQRQKKEGSLVNVSLTISPVISTAGNLIGISKIARDMTQRVELHQKLEGQVRQRERFLAILSHELRNPVNAVSIAVAVLNNETSAVDDRISALGSLRRQVDMLRHLLEDLLDVARITEDRISLEFTTFDLCELALEIKDLVQGELERHACTLEYHLPSGPVWVHGDRTRLVQVQVNLIHNAAKYSGTSLPIEVKLEFIDSEIHLTVADKGRGIPVDRLESIFEPFSQLDDARENGDGGLGIGLTLSRSLVELHGGRIFAESHGPGSGATFHIWLPCANDLKSLDDRSNSNPLRSSHTSSEPSSDRKNEVPPLRICIVEDLDDTRELMRTLLELDGHQVRTASNGQSGLQCLFSDTFDLALIDIGLPDMTGYEVIRQFRSTKADTSLKAIALTGFGQSSDVQRATTSGFDGHLVKPVDPEQLQNLCLKVGSERTRVCG